MRVSTPLVQALQNEKPKLLLPRPEGRVTVERRPVPAAGLEGAGPQWRDVRAGAGRVACHRRPFGVRQVHARAHPRRLPGADRRQGSSGWHGAAQLGSASVRRVHGLSSARGRAVPGHDQAECLPHARRSARRAASTRRRRSRAFTTWFASCPTATRPCSIGAGRPSREGRSSALLSRGPSSAIPHSSCWTSPTRTWTRPASRP